MLHLDSCFLIRALASGSVEDRRLRDILRRGVEVATSIIAWAEFLCGPVAPHQVTLATRVVTHRLPLEEGDAALAAELFSRSG
jgi:predicted nucleic acid-binding protein